MGGERRCGKKKQCKFSSRTKSKSSFLLLFCFVFAFFAHAGEIRQQRSHRGLRKDLLFKKITLHRRSGEPMAGGGSYTGITKSNKEAKKGGTEASPPPSLTW